MFCPKCGLQNNHSHKFCPRCGMALANAPAPKKNKKPLIILFVLLFICCSTLLASGIFILFTGSNKDDDALFAETNAHIKDFEDIGAEYLDSNGYVKEEDLDILMDDLVSEAKNLKSDDIISEYHYDDDSKTLFMKFDESEIGYLYIPQVEGILASGDDAYLATYEPLESDSSGYPTYIDQAANYVTDSLVGSFVLEYEYENNDVSLMSLYTMEDAEIIIWKGHGGYAQDIGYFFQIGEEYTESFYKNHKDLFSSDELVVLDNGFVGVSENYIDYYMGANAFEGCLVYFGTCSSAKDITLTDIFINHGAVAVIANTDVVSSYYNASMIEAFYKAYATPDSSGAYRTLTEALSVAKSEISPYDCYISQSTMDTYGLTAPSEVTLAYTEDCTIQDLYEKACPNAIIQEEITPTEETITEESNLTYADIYIEFERNYEDAYEYCTLTAYDTAGDIVWSYRSDNFDWLQNDDTEYIVQIENQYIYIEGGIIISRDVLTGEALWSNTDFNSTLLQALVDEETERIYLCGDFGPDFMCITTSGETIKKIDSFDSQYSNVQYFNWREVDHLYFDIIYAYGPDGYDQHEGYSFTISADDYTFEPV